MKPGPRPGRTQRRAAAAIVGAVLVLIALRSLVLQPVGVAGDSMEPTVGAGDVALVLRLTDVAHDLRRGDLMVFRDPDGALALKRVVGLPGDDVAIQDGQLVVNGRVVKEPYVDPTRLSGVYFGPSHVPSGHLFVMGDNRSRSIDSRAYGAVADDAVVGRVVLHW